MKINDLSANQNGVEIEAKVIELGDAKTINKYGREIKLRTAVINDESGSIKLTLWNEDTDKFNVGDSVKISNGYVTEFQNEKQLTAGKFGKIAKIESNKTDGSVDSPITIE